ncbi:hypothetical protein J4727_16150 [Providencia rettgeri]|uniref:Uncharacterized protein n=1 Tax=Providencia rettgeri TaxID=587 RepID=A0A939SLU9_PRORE|nr:hypothetical protein [Providencia rettgeri]
MRPKECFDYEPSIVEKIKGQDTIWFGQPIFNVTLEVSRDVAFTLNVKHFCQTKIIEKRQDGTLVISSSAWNYNQIAPLFNIGYLIFELSPCELDTYIRKNLGLG